MKTFLTFIVLGGAVFFLYAWFYDNPSAQKRFENSLSSTKDAPSAPAGQAPMQASGPSSGTTAAPPAGAPAPAPASKSALPQIQDVAKQVGVTIKNIQFNGKNVPVTVDWIGDATIGGDFVAQLLRQGIIRNFDDVPGGSYYADEQGRAHFNQSFVLQLP